jgi:hypothetical protein
LLKSKQLKREGQTSLFFFVKSPKRATAPEILYHTSHQFVKRKIAKNCTNFNFPICVIFFEKSIDKRPLRWYNNIEVKRERKIMMKEKLAMIGCYAIALAFGLMFGAYICGLI